MVRPVVRSIDTIDEVIDLPGGGFAPPDPDFAVLIDAYIGPAGAEGEELFRFTVCSPSWMDQEVFSGGAHWLRAYLLLERWNYVVVTTAVTKICQSIDEPTRSEVAAKLNRYLWWEFEDYPG